MFHLRLSIISIMTAMAAILIAAQSTFALPGTVKISDSLKKHLEGSVSRKAFIGPNPFPLMKIELNNRTFGGRITIELHRLNLNHTPAIHLNGEPVLTDPYSKGLTLLQGTLVRKVGRKSYRLPIGASMKQMPDGTKRIITGYMGCNRETRATRICEATITIGKGSKGRIHNQNNIDSLKVKFHPGNPSETDENVHVHEGIDFETSGDVSVPAEKPLKFHTRDGGDTYRQVEMAMFTEPTWHAKWGAQATDKIAELINSADARMRAKLGITLIVRRLYLYPSTATSPFYSGPDLATKLDSLRDHVAANGILDGDLNHLMIGEYGGGPIGRGYIMGFPSPTSAVCQTYIKSAGYNSGATISFYNSVVGDSTTMEHEIGHTLPAYQHDADPSQWLMSPGSTGVERNYSPESLTKYAAFLNDSSSSFCLEEVSGGSSPTPTPTATPTSNVTGTPTNTPTHTATPTRTPDQTQTPSSTITPFIRTPTPLPTPTSGASPKPEMFTVQIKGFNSKQSTKGTIQITKKLASLKDSQLSATLMRGRRQIQFSKFRKGKALFKNITTYKRLRAEVRTVVGKRTFKILWTKKL